MMIKAKFWLSLVLSASMANIAAPATPVQALSLPNPSVITVDTPIYQVDPNDGKCSLAEALQSAFNGDNLPVDTCAGSKGDSLVKFSFTGVIKLTDRLPDTHNSVSIIGPITLDGNAQPLLIETIVPSGVLTLTNMTLSNAGWTFLDNKGELYVAGVNFQGNNSGGTGAGALINEGKAYIAGASFLGNKAQANTSGGAIRSAPGAVLKIAGSAFTGNNADQNGGAISFGGGELDIADTAFTGNTVNGGDFKGGGAIYITNDSNTQPITLTRVAFTGNAVAAGWGGAIFANTATTVTIKDSSFQGNLVGSTNSISGTGGAIGNVGPLVVQRSTFLANASAGDGGAITNDHDGQVTLASISFSANTATGKGGAFANTNTTDGMALQAFNVTMAGNVAQTGGGIYNEESTYDVITITNSILSLNLPFDCADSDVNSLPLRSGGHNLIDDLSCITNGAGDSNAPALLEPPGVHGGPISTLTVQRPSIGSPAIDAGDNAICTNAFVEKKDVRGSDRPVDGNADGVKQCDIGAVETEALVAKYDAQPSAPGPIDLGNATVGTLIKFSALLLHNSGDASLILSNPSLSGPHAADFAVSGWSNSMLPKASVDVQLACTPSAVGPRTAMLSFVTNDVDHLSVSYSLLCEGVAAPTAGFLSDPFAPGPVSSSTEQGKSIKLAIKVSENGNLGLSLSNPILLSNPPGAFVFDSNFPIDIADGAPPENVTVACTALTPGLSTGSLAFSTNDPAHPNVSYNLACNVAKLPDAPLATDAISSVSNGAPNAFRGPYGIAISPDGKHVYATDDGDDKINLFTRGNDNTLANSQQLLTAQNPGLTRTMQVMVSPDGRNVYATGASGNGIASYARDAASGQLTFQSAIHDSDNLFCIVFCAPPPKVHGLRGAYGMAISPDGQYVYVSSIVDSSIDIFQRSQISTSFGSLHQMATISNTTYDFGAGFVQQYTNTQLTGAYGIAMSPDGANLYATGYNSDSLLVLKRNPSNGKLAATQVLTTFAASGLDGVFRVIVSEDGKFVYTAAFDSNSVCAFGRSQIDGKLTALGCYRSGVGSVANLVSASDVALSPDGTHLFATAYDSAAAVVFDRDANTGALTYAQAIVRDGGTGLPPLAGARGVVVSPEGDAIYVAAHGDDKIVTIPFAHPKPVASAVIPASVVQSNVALSLTVNGTDFLRSSLIRWNGVDHSTEFVNANQLKTTISVADQAAIEDAAVTVFNPAPAGGVSGALAFTVLAPQSSEPLVPGLAQITPQGVPAGSDAVTITVEGSDFASNAQVLWNGLPKLMTRVNNKLLYAVIPATDLQQVGINTVQVFNPGTGLNVLSAHALEVTGRNSNILQFEVSAVSQNPPPAINSLSPASANTLGGASELVVAIHGSNFLPSTQARWNGADRPTQFVSAAQLSMTISAGDLVAVGNATVSTVNPTPGGGESNLETFNIYEVGSNPIPVADTLKLVPGAGVLQVTLFGSGFADGAQLLIDGVSYNATVLNAGQLQATLNGPAVQFDRAFVIAARNVAPGGGDSNALVWQPRRILMPVMRR